MDIQRDIIAFGDPDALTWLERADDEALDGLEFGVIAMDPSGVVVAYNTVESVDSGLSQRRVIGRNFFDDVAPCTNNFMVAQRYADEDQLDDTIAYVFTLKMRPRRVRLRLLKTSTAARQYMLVENVA